MRTVSMSLGLIFCLSTGVYLALLSKQKYIRPILQTFNWKIWEFKCHAKLMVQILATNNHISSKKRSYLRAEVSYGQRYGAHPALRGQGDQIKLCLSE